MSAAATVTVTGFGLRVTPIEGQLFRLHVDGDALVVEHAKVEAAASTRAWWIDTPAYRIPLPPSWILRAGGESTASAFELLGPSDATISVRATRRMPSIEAFQGTGHVFRDIGQLERAGWIEFEEPDGSRTWLHRHEQLHRGTSPFIVTLRAPLEHASAHLPVLASIVEQLELPRA
jgi:hypothetical protein